ncbi:glycosyltransferase family 2 protein [Megalodesulfovibrio gigas]|uniref:Glycosyl transferase family 2 n=1 Tax=Megalodesulfovibrio gigas (strain ATCC 19364 / DSM 1382 / NCIMB 9332 / VKM B-1759) TaxID=1121448 RepID=T2GG98_MEGG1|nr:glycosyltransferase [Megalodesulfovibrio gigas]AGW15221.1 glycosyl transferase family 2 [Megalodesulfovibrio gigas DSM 1382 = ATCC 19364]
MNQPLVSVVVPAYNQAQYLRACLDSLWFQEYPDLELVVVNDGATDHTPEVLEQFQQDLDTLQTSFASCFNEANNTIERTVHPVYPRQGRTLRIVTHERNRGLAAALNTGWQAATGVYCTYVPCDDLAYPHMLAELVQALEAGPAEFAYADMHIVDDAMHILRRFSLPAYSPQACFGDWYLCGVCKLYRRSLHERFGGYDEALLAHDHALFQRFALGGAACVHVPKALMAVRDHPKSRQVDIHAPSNWNRLLEESKCLVREARQALDASKGA